MIMTSLKQGFGGLARFSGRSSREQFWPFAILLVLIGVAAMIVTVGTLMSDMMVRMQRFAATHPDQVTEQRGPGSYSVEIQGYHPELMPNLSGAMVAMSIVTLIIVLLLAAAVSRRLHDTDRPGWWGLMPLPFLAFGFVGMSLLFERMGTDSGDVLIPWSFALFFNNLIYLATLVLLTILLAAKGTTGPNRYGEEPL